MGGPDFLYSDKASPLPFSDLANPTGSRKKSYTVKEKQLS